jgi:hypothetical protein
MKFNGAEEIPPKYWGALRKSMNHLYEGIREAVHPEEGSAQRRQSIHEMIDIPIKILRPAMRLPSQSYRQYPPTVYRHSTLS